MSKNKNDKTVLKAPQLVLEFLLDLLGVNVLAKRRKQGQNQLNNRIKNEQRSFHKGRLLSLAMEQFVAQNYAAAEVLFSEALSLGLNGSIHGLAISFRANSYMKLNEFELALKDYEACLPYKGLLNEPMDVADWGRQNADGRLLAQKLAYCLKVGNLIASPTIQAVLDKFPIEDLKIDGRVEEVEIQEASLYLKIVLASTTKL